ncbi:MAG: DUF1634 domain-containing protein [Elusimicrobia bacterium]|nr:DUF1634 domain-containing protein [Elusimicrobiota bacterium]
MSSQEPSAVALAAQARERRRRGDRDIHTVSAWILRGGVVASTAVMLLGLVLSFAQTSPTVARMQTLSYSGDIGAILRRAAAGDGVALIELGVLMLVMTPILRVAGSMVLFATEERDWFYATVTFLVLVLTLTSLLVLR